MEVQNKQRGRRRGFFRIAAAVVGAIAAVSMVGTGMVEASDRLPAPIPSVTDVTDTGFTVNVDITKYDCAGFLFEIHALPAGTFVTRDSGSECLNLHSIPVDGLKSCELYQVTVRTQQDGKISDLRRTTVTTLCEPLEPPSGP